MMNKHLRIITILLIVGVLSIGIYLFLSRAANNRTFKGQIKDQDCQIDIGSSRCTWKIDDRTVSWSWGSSEEGRRTGEVQGLDISKKDGAIGKTVEVYGTKTGINTYTIENPGEYIRLIQ